MKPNAEAPVRRVKSCNGRVWETNVTGAAEYIFNPVFMTFFVLCVILYATLMQPSEETSLPIPAQMILWGGLIMSSLVWLFGSIWLSIYAFDRGLLKAIYTPLILLPLVLINSTLAEFVLSVFNQGFQGSYGSRVESIVQNTIILVTFDIMHERFVVPQHPRFVSSSSAIVSVGNLSEPIHTVERRVTTSPPTPVANTGTPTTVAPIPQAGSQPSAVFAADSSRPEHPKYINIARERIEACAILWIKSEDHYLNIQLKNRSLMLRGKLRTTVDELGDELGIQINRSAWVAYSAIRTVDEQTNGNVDVCLEDESIHRVASTRRLIFNQNYDRFKAAMECGAE